MPFCGSQWGKLCQEICIFCINSFDFFFYFARRILSDCIPIRGRKRVPYLIIATMLSLVPWIILGLNDYVRSSQWHLIVFLTAQNLGSAMADVVVDAMIAEAVKSEQYVHIISFFMFLSSQVLNYIFTN